jgi:hypothetical protein
MCWQEKGMVSILLVDLFESFTNKDFAGHREIWMLFVQFLSALVASDPPNGFISNSLCVLEFCKQTVYR